MLILYKMFLKMQGMFRMMLKVADDSKMTENAVNIQFQNTNIHIFKQ